jgi:two-component system, sensor histidine kinase
MKALASEILKAQIDHVLDQISITGLLNIAAVTLTIVVLWNRYPSAWVVGWCSVSYTILSARLIFYIWLKPQTRALRGEAQQRGYRRLRYTLVAGSLLASVVWSSAALLFLQHPDSEEFVFISLVIAGMISGSLPVLAAYLPGYLAFVVPTTATLIYQYFNLGLWSSGVLASMYTLGLILFSNKLRKTITNTITIDFKNTELLDAVTLAKNHAERANRAKSEFLAAASHDLRQPLHAMGLLLSVLNDRSVRNDDSNRPLLDQLLHAHDALTMMFNSLLEISRLESGAVDVEIVDVSLASILNTLIAEFKPRIEAKNLLLIEQWHDCSVRTDPMLLNRILRNLLDNALKFTARGHIKITAQTQGERIELTIEDSGIGIPQAEQERIFEEYYQLNNKGRDRNAGIGLGLAVVQKMAQLLRHEVNVSSAPGQGTIFSVWLAAGAAHTGAIASDSFALEDIMPASGHTVHGDTARDYIVLVIDDDLAVLAAMRSMLEHSNCRVLTAISASAALALLQGNGFQDNGLQDIGFQDNGFEKKNTPDILISDYRLKDGATGFEAIDALRAHLGAAIPAIVISGDTDPELLQRARARQLFLLSKPVKPAHLKNVMRQLLDQLAAPPASELITLDH